MSATFARAALALAVVAAGAGAAKADRIKNPTAQFSGLDKITGRIVSFAQVLPAPPRGISRARYTGWYPKREEGDCARDRQDHGSRDRGA